MSIINCVHRFYGEVNGMTFFQSGKIHRDDGPAVIYFKQYTNMNYYANVEFWRYGVCIKGCIGVRNHEVPEITDGI